MSDAASPTMNRPDIRRAFEHLAECMTPAPGANPIVALRAGVDRYGDAEPRGPIAGVTFQPTGIPGVAAEWVMAPESDPTRRLVYLHGGGWIAGSLHSHRLITAYLARRAGCAVLAVDYRLAPEYPFPAGLDDSTAAIRWASGNGPDGVDEAATLALAGDSAGGNLAAAACVRLIEQGSHVPDKLVLICASLDVAPQAGATGGNPNDFVSRLAMLMSLYAPNSVRESAELSPINASPAILRHFPPTLLQASTTEHLLADAQNFMARMAAAGNRAILSVWPAMPHVWHAFLSLLPEASAALDEITDFLRK